MCTGVIPSVEEYTKNVLFLLSKKNISSVAALGFMCYTADKSVLSGALNLQPFI